MAATFTYPEGYWQPIDDTARDGRSRLVWDTVRLACARWDGEKFVFPASSGMPLDFEPTEYHP